MKICTKCKIQKDSNDFYVQKAHSTGRTSKCKVCSSADGKIKRLLEPERFKKYNKDRYLRNKEEICRKTLNNYYKNHDKNLARKRKYGVQYRKSNIERDTKLRALKVNERHSYLQNNKEKLARKSKEYRNKNPDIINAITAKRRAARYNATPKWLTKEHLLEIRQFYKEAKRLEKETGIKHQVDHIIPLQGETVSGLHLPWNLQVLTFDENIRKKNKLLPEHIHGN